MIDSALLPLIVIWFVRDIKYILFWIYLWQLKQYHLGRFLDHFKTEKGKSLIFNQLQIGKILLIFVWVLVAIFSLENVSLLLIPVLFIIYFVEVAIYLKAVFYRKAKYPKFTKKTAFLFLVNIFIVINFPFWISLLTKTGYWFGFSLLVFDILLPMIVSAVVLLFQPLADYYRLSLQAKAKIKIDSLKDKLKIIAVVGSYGKTSTKEYLNTILSSKFKVLCTKEHKNTEIGIPLTILNDLKPEHEIFIAEIGAYDKGTIKRTCDFLQPNIGLVTGVNEQHLSLFGSMENLLSAEGGQELLKCLPQNGFLVVNGENKYCMDLYNKANIAKIAYTFSQAGNILVKKDSISFSFDNQDVQLNILGRHNVLNLLGAIQIAKKLGMSTQKIIEALKRIENGQGSYKIYKNEKGLTIIDSTYSSNPDGVIADLDYLNLFSGKKVIVMPCLIELGQATKDVHAKIGKKINEVCDLGIVTTEEHYQDIKGSSGKILFISETADIIEKLKDYYDKEAVVLLEGRLQEGIAQEIKK